jgi:hypothetical protein
MDFASSLEDGKTVVEAKSIVAKADAVCVDTEIGMIQPIGQI